MGPAAPGETFEFSVTPDSTHRWLSIAAMQASSGLERLEEDGDPQPLVDALPTNGVDSSGVVDTPDGAGAAGPLEPGDSYSFTVTTDSTNRFLSLAGMVVPSNDTFMAVGPSGLELVDSSGDRRSEQDIANDIVSALEAWDAGTETNQAGAAGPDQPPRQSGPDTGAPEGDGTVRALSETVWTYPDVSHVLRVTVEPVE